MNKYNARKTTVDGIIFDSAAEAARYNVLKLMERGRLITDLTLQPEFILQKAFRKNGKTYRKIVYRADFQYTDCRTGKTVIEDVKGLKTKEYAIKRKLFEYRYPDLEITEVE